MLSLIYGWKNKFFALENVSMFSYISCTKSSLLFFWLKSLLLLLMPQCYNLNNFLLSIFHAIYCLSVVTILETIICYVKYIWFHEKSECVAEKFCIFHIVSQTQINPTCNRPNFNFVRVRRAKLKPSGFKII